MNIRTKEGVTLLAFQELEELSFLTHAFSTRFGGVSEGIYASMNFKEDGEDTEENVRENYRRIAKALDCDISRFVRSSLVHGKRIHLVEKADYGEGTVRKTKLLGYDGLMTDEPGVTLVATFADCVPLYFADPVHKAIALSHSGWRGTAEKIGAETLKAMQAAYGTRAEDVIVGIGPCICKNCYEVGQEVADAFSKEALTKKGNGKYELDLQKANQLLLIEAGVLKEHIALADLCTCCNSSFLFSHRATGGKRGAMAAFLSIKE